MTGEAGDAPGVPASGPLGRPATSLARLRWRDIYREADLVRAALRVYTKPLFQWRKALSTSVDGRTLYDFASHGLRRLDALHAALARERFQYRPSLALHYNFNGRHRTIYLAPWEERIVDLFLYRALNAKWHGSLSPNAYAYRTHGFGLDRCQTRIAGVIRRAAGRPIHVVKRDIAEYFASVDHDLLIEQLRARVDPADHLFGLLVQRVRFAYVEDLDRHQATRGIPFGTAIACLFANVYLDDLDRAVEAVPGVQYFRYADDLLVLAGSSQSAREAALAIDAELERLRLTLKASHHADFVLGDGSTRVTAAKPAFRHLGLLFREGGSVALSRDKLRKIQNLFRFAFRRSRRRWARLEKPEARVAALAAIAADTAARGVRNVAILDYYLKHVTDERQIRLLDRWLAEEVLAAVFGGHRKGHFRRMSFADLRAMGLPSLVHRRRLLRRGELDSAFFIWQRQKATRGLRGTVARPVRDTRGSTFSPFPDAAAH